MSHRPEDIAGWFDARYPVRDPGRRALGREAEFPVVGADGQAADISPLWRRLAEGHDGHFQYDDGRVVAWVEEDVIYTAEVGRGTIEVIVGPHPDLVALDDAMEAGVVRLVDAASAEGLRVLGYGVQPLTPPHRALMTPKPRYGVLLDEIGDDWLSFSVTAADQVHVDVARDEVIAVTNLMNLLAPLVVALCANSPIAAGIDQGVASWRAVAMGRIGAGSFRHGMPEGPSEDLAAWVGRTFPMPFLMEKTADGPKAAGAPFGTWLAGKDLSPEDAWDAWLLHEHYIWNAARPRAAHGTVEIRGACQQPWREHGAVAALSTGLVEGHRAIAARIRDALGPDPWPVFRAWSARTVQDGAAASVPDEVLIQGILDDAEAALILRGRGEASRLRPLRERWETRRSPAHAARDAFEAGGMAGLIDAVALR